jgi:hypothetical protein
MKRMFATLTVAVALTAAAMILAQTMSAAPAGTTTLAGLKAEMGRIKADATDSDQTLAARVDALTVRVDDLDRRVSEIEHGVAEKRPIAFH